MNKFSHVILGGTFDLLHDGHKALLNKAFEVGEKVTIGITNDFFAQKNRNIKYQISLPSRQAGNIKSRKKELEDYLKSKCWLNRTEIIEINDRYGTTLTNKKLDAIIVSSETEAVAKEINQLRLKKNWLPLSIIKIPWKLADDGHLINSRRIRRGEIDRNGKLFILEKNWGQRVLPEDLRTEFKKPMGRLVKNIESIIIPASPVIPAPACAGRKAGILTKDPRVQACLPAGRPEDDRLIIAIGDATVFNLLKNKIIPDISIVDLKIKRRVVYQKVEDLGFREIKLLKKAKNRAGTINYAVFQTLSSLIKSEAKPAVMQIIGEDDLLTLLAVFLAPLGSLIVYGQPNEGLVVVEVNEENKQKAREYLERFKKTKLV